MLLFIYFYSSKWHQHDGGLQLCFVTHCYINHSLWFLMSHTWLMGLTFTLKHASQRSAVTEWRVDSILTFYFPVLIITEACCLALWMFHRWLIQVQGSLMVGCCTDQKQTNKRRRAWKDTAVVVIAQQQMEVLMGEAGVFLTGAWKKQNVRMGFSNSNNETKQYTETIFSFNGSLGKI